MADSSNQPVVDRDPADRLSPAPPWATARSLMAACEARTRALSQPQPAIDLLTAGPEQPAEPRAGSHSRASR